MLEPLAEELADGGVPVCIIFPTVSVELAQQRFGEGDGALFGRRILH